MIVIVFRFHGHAFNRKGMGRGMKLDLISIPILLNVWQKKIFVLTLLYIIGTYLKDCRISAGGLVAKHHNDLLNMQLRLRDALARVWRLLRPIMNHGVRRILVMVTRSLHLGSPILLYRYKCHITYCYLTA